MAVGVRFPLRVQIKNEIVMEDYKLAVEMYKQYQNDVVKVGVSLNIFQLKTLQLLENNFRNLEPKKLTLFQKLIGAFKNRKR